MTVECEDFDLSTVGGVVETVAALLDASRQAKAWMEPGYCHPGTSSKNPCRVPACIARAVRYSGEWSGEAAHHARRLEGLVAAAHRIAAAVEEAPRATREGMGAIPHDDGVTFRVWAPHATRVAVVGSFNGWDDTRDVLAHEDHGYWSIDVRAARVRDEYRYVITTADGTTLSRIDPYAREVTNSVGNGVVHDPAFDWVREQVEAMAKVLRDLERDEDGACPWCHEFDLDDTEGEGEGHAFDCALDAALRMGER